LTDARVTARIPAAIVPALRALLAGKAVDWPELTPEDWGRAVTAFDDQGALPLVHAADGALAGAAGVGRSTGRVPEPLALPAAAAYYRTAAHNALLLAERDALLDELAALGVCAVPLKGAALLGTAYPNIALRPLGDLDLLVAEHDLARVDAHLVARGFAQQLSGIPRLRHHLEYARVLPSGVPVLVEVHRRLLASPALDAALPAADVLARAAPDPLAGGTSIPSPADLLLHAAAHLVVQHAREERLVWVADIDRIVRRWLAAPAAGADAAPSALAPVPWPRVLSTASAAGLADALGGALAAAVLWFGTPLPSAAQRLADAALKPTPPAALRRFRAHAPVGREGARVVQDALAHQSLAAGVGFALRSAFPSPAYMRTWYGVDHPVLLPIYYAARLGRGLWHLAAQATRPAGERRQAAEPPDRWMVDG